jgi:hypothetical protein
MATEGERELERRLQLTEQARRELGEQVEHLVELLEESRREIRWLKGELAKRGGAAATE